jgi:chaperonin GroEL (HSP60 family)
MIKALWAPFDLLLSNCGEDLDLILPDLMVEINKNPYALPTMVFDAEEHEFVNPYTAGIIEPAKVCRVSIGNALSVASLLITLGGIVVVPRDTGMEQQMEMADQAFKRMMDSAQE